MKMSAEVADRYFQGKENVPVAIARRRIKTGGDMKAALALIPITKPVYAQYRDGWSSRTATRTWSRRRYGLGRRAVATSCELRDARRAGDDRRGRRAAPGVTPGDPAALGRASGLVPARREGALGAGRAIAERAGAHRRAPAPARPLARRRSAAARRAGGSPSAT